jgi:cytochrome c2
MKVSAPVIATTILILAMAFWGCGNSRQAELRAMARMTGGGDGQAGQEWIREKGCITCHTLRSVPGARGLVGPVLDGIADRSYIAGQLPNIPSNMILWVQHPHQVDPKTVMPEMGLTDQDSRDIAAYLYMEHKAN